MTEPAVAATRSWLFTPGTRPDRFAKASAVGADVAIIDLEDSVAPNEKARAREVVLGYLASPQNARGRIALRINGLDKAAGVADVNALLHVRAWPDFLVLPKTETSGHLQILDRLLAAGGANTHLIGIVESAAGLAAVEAISAATPRLAGLMLGAADLAADLGAVAAWEPLAFARSRLVAASALHAVVPIDSPFFDIHDERGLREETGRAVALGFEAKAAIHPNQIAIINAALTPTEAAVAKARAIIAENAKGVGTVGGEMVDEAVARKARRVLAAAAITR
jgi:(S)-citramalyl-CoA lyase